MRKAAEMKQTEMEEMKMKPYGVERCGDGWFVYRNTKQEVCYSPDRKAAKNLAVMLNYKADKEQKEKTKKPCCKQS